MRFVLHGLSEDTAGVVAAALVEAGHEEAEPATFAVVAIEADVGVELIELSDAAWAGAVTDVRRAFFALQETARTMVEHKTAGRIAVVVPAHALRTAAGCGLGAIAGSFLVTAAQVAAVELGARGIRVNVLALGPREGHAPAAVRQAVPLRRLVAAEDVAAACRLLASDDAAYLSGAVIAVDGGYHVTKAVGGSPYVAR